MCAIEQSADICGQAGKECILVGLEVRVIYIRLHNNTLFLVIAFFLVSSNEKA
jgi:hypothetical protein